MKKLFKNYYNNIKEYYMLEKNILFAEGFLLIIASLIAFIFERNKASTITILYILPISLVILSILSLYYANKTKTKETKYFIVPIFESLFYLAFVFTIIIGNATEYGIVTILGIITIFNLIFSFLRYEKHSLMQYINYILITVISIISIVFSSYIIQNLYQYFILFYLLLGIKKIITVFILNRVNK